MNDITILANTLEYNSGLIGGLYIRCFGPFVAGRSINGHQHHIDHATFVEEGKVRIEISDSRFGPKTKVMVVEAPNFIHVPATAFHKITALADGTKWRCIFSAVEAEKHIEDDEILKHFYVGRKLTEVTD